jgi:hypothetical protein
VSTQGDRRGLFVPSSLAHDRNLNSEERRLNRKLRQCFALLAFLTAAAQTVAQAPAGSAPASGSKQQTVGFTLNTSFGGSADSDSDVFAWTTTTGYIFNKHFSADVGVPILFVQGTTSTGSSANNAGLGNVFGQITFIDKNPTLNFGSVATVALPTGDTSKGFSTGRVTADWTSQIAKEFGRFTPFLSAGLANSIFDSRSWRRPYTTLGDLAHFEGGTAFDLGNSLTLSASAYDIAPWGTQKLYSRIVAKGAPGGGQSNHGRVFQNNSLTTGGSSIDAENGYNADLDFSPWKYVDLDFGYTHSVHFQLDTFAFSVGFNLSPLLRRGSSFRN